MAKNIVDLSAGYKECVILLLPLFFLTACASGGGDDDDNDTIELVPAVTASQPTPICLEYSNQIDCIFMTALPFYDMDATLNDWCGFCGEEFSYCMLAFKTECPVIFPDTSVCLEVGNCILYCSSLFCHDSDTAPYLYQLDELDEVV